MVSVADKSYEPDFVFPPGNTLEEVLENLGMTQAALAKRTGLSTKHINQIVNGAAPITPETALVFERATGVTARTWSNLEVIYREFLLQAEDGSRLEADLGWLNELPIKELVQRECITRRDQPIDTLREVCRFFGVANFAAWETLWQKPTAYRTSKAFASNPGAVASWLRLGEIEAAKIDSEPFDKAGLTEAIDDFRRLTCEPEPGKWWPELVHQCAKVGVAVVGEPEFKGARINGAARWLSPDKALVQLSLRYNWNDIFWFTFFHEIGHLLIHSKKDAFINNVGSHSGAEEEADGFASQILIPRRHEAELSDIKTVIQAKDFAKKIGVAPGIVVGRLQHDKYWLFKDGNELKQRFHFVPA